VQVVGSHHQLFKVDLIALFVDPGPLLFVCGAKETLGTSQGLDVEVGDPASVPTLAVTGQRDPYFVLGVEHHVVFPEPAWSVKNTDHTLLHPHVVGRNPPGERIVAAALVAFAVFRQCNTAFAVGEPCAWAICLVGYASLGVCLCSTFTCPRGR